MSKHIVEYRYIARGTKIKAFNDYQDAVRFVEELKKKSHPVVMSVRLNEVPVYLVQIQRRY